jgi:cytidine deaminase
MVNDPELYQQAREVLNPRRLSPLADAGGVGSALVTDRGNVYVGVCIDTSSSMGFCAEHNAIGNMITNGESRILTIVAVNWDGRILPPCGRCREFIYQMDTANVETRVLLHGDRVSTIGQLLPDHWAQEL